jgi:serine O-acetyltransferase
LDSIVDQLRISREHTHLIRHQGQVRELPSGEMLRVILNSLCAVLFPTHYGRSDLTEESIDYFVGNELGSIMPLLTEQVRRGLLFATGEKVDEKGRLHHKALCITREFITQLPSIRALLVSDIRAAFQGDPAAKSMAEVLLCYPGTIAIIYYRLAHALWLLGARLLARIMSGIAHSKTGIDIHPGAEIGGSFFIDHGTGVVIGETTIIGARVRLYQAVTLGAKRFPSDAEGNLIKGQPRHPIVEDDVVIYAGATVLGRIVIGCGSTIGGNVWLTESVPPSSRISQAQMRDDI